MEYFYDLIIFSLYLNYVKVPVWTELVLKIEDVRK
jgi:hypothetical protein